jgi:uncharacterized protein (TIGR03435 family)
MMASKLKTNFARCTLLIACAIILFATPIVLTQSIPSPAPLLGADGKPLTFTVVSIREDKSEPGPQNPVQAGPTSDGYRLQNAPLFAAIQTAYVPTLGSLSFRPNQITGVPPWASYSSSTRYDINAKVSEADLPKWQDPAQQPAMLRAMLQAMLADRFHLTIHRENREVPIYELSVGNKKPKLKPSDATTLADIRREHPDAILLRTGTIVTIGPDPGQQTVYGVTMQDLGTLLSNLAGRPIEDKTGLPGKYDITYQIEQRPPSQEDGSATPMPADFFNLQIFNIIQDQLGLKLSAAKGSAVFLIIDRVDPPSEN